LSFCIFYPTITLYQKDIVMNKRFYPVSERFFNIKLLPIVESSYIWRGRPPKISHYTIFCAAMYVLRTGISWRDLPPQYGNWNAVYQRVKRAADRGVWWKILVILQRDKDIKMRIVMADSTTIKYHRHGGGLKGGSKARGEVLAV
jgi:transposase